MSTRAANKEDAKALWQNLQVLFFAIVAAAILFLLLSLIIFQWRGAFLPEWAAHRKWILAGLAALTFPVLILARGALLQHLAHARSPGPELAARLLQYKQGLVKYLAFSELVIVAGGLLFMYTGDFTYLAFAAVIIGFMLGSRPRKSRLGNLLNLDQQQLAELD